MSKLSDAEARFLVGDSDALTPQEPVLALCRSKQAQHDFFLSQNFPAPQDFPDGSEPYIVRPDCAEGGRGIWVTDDYCEAGGAVNANFVTQEELSGAVFSVQLLGAGGRFAALPAVELTMDDRYDRCRAAYRAGLDPDGTLHTLALQVAQALALDGAAEMKAVLHGGKFYCLALNAGLAPLSSSALYFAGLHVADALDALKRGDALPTAKQDAAVSLMKNGRTVGSRETDDIGELRREENALTDGRIQITCL